MGWASRLTNPFSVVVPPTAVPGLALWLRADQGITFGGAEVPVHFAGGGPAGVRPTGTPVATVHSVEVDIDGNGGVGVATFTWKLNGVVQAAHVLTAAAVVLGATGITWNFANGAYTVADVYTTVPLVATWTSMDGSATAFTQAVVANMPQWIAPGLVLSGFAAGLNGQATIRFNGTSTVLANAGFHLAQPFSFYAIVKSANPATATTILFEDGNGEVLVVNGTQPYWYLSCEAGAGFILNETTSGLFGGGLLSGIANGASSQFPISHLPGGSLGAFGIVNGLSIGASTTPNDWWTGDLSEAFFYSHAVLPAEDAAMRVYACNRYALP